MGVKFGKVSEIAARQHGRVTTAQLRACGFGNGSIEKAVAAGRLHRVHTGVYAVGHLAPSRLGDWHAAVLACGSEAVLSHRSAATLFNVRDGVGPRIDVTIPSGGRKRPGIAIHRARLEPWERTTWQGIPVTSPARTLVDLAHTLRDADAVGWALREMQFKRLYDRRLVELAVARRPSRLVSALLDDLPKVRSPLELAFHRKVIRAFGLPEPECQYRIAGLRVDFAWPEAKLAVEVDGRNHDLPAMRLADTVRNALLAGAGFDVLRFRWSDIHRTAAATAAAIAEFHPR